MKGFDDILFLLYVLELYIKRKISFNLQCVIVAGVTGVFSYALRFSNLWHISVYEIITQETLDRLELQSLYYSINSFNFIFIIPFIFTLFYFYYRKQGSISESYLLRNDISFSVLFFTMFAFWMIIWAGNISEYIFLPNVLCLIFSIAWIIYFINFVFSRIRVSYLIDNNYRQIYNLFKYYEVKLVKNNHCFNILIYGELEWKIEILYQLIEHVEKNGINSALSKAIGYLTKILILIKWNTRNINYKEFDECIALYESILREHRKLIISLHRSYRYQEVQECLTSLFKFYSPRLSKTDDKQKDKIIDEFYLTFWILAKYFLTCERHKFQIIINKLKRNNKTPLEISNFIVVIKALIVFCIENNNLIYMTEVCYIATDFLNTLSDDKADEVEKKNYYIKQMEKIIQEKDKREHYEGVLVYILLQGTIKTIELGQYELTGFLIKYVVSNFKQGIIESAYLKINDNDIISDKKLEVISIMKNIKVYFSINPQTAVYCLKKLTILLYLQQQYRNHDNKCINLNLFNNENGDNYSKKYCLLKILNVKEKYGLLALKNESNVRKLILGIDNRSILCKLKEYIF